LPCRINDPGRPMGAVGADGSKTLGELLVELANTAGPQGKRYYNLMFGLARGILEATLVSDSLKVVAACTSLGASEKRGDECLSMLRGLAGEKPLFGLGEVYDMGDDGVERFLRLYGDARVSRPRSLYWVAGFEEEKEEEEKPKPRPAGLGITRTAMSTIEDPDLFMARVALTSRILRYTRTRDPAELHREARDASASDPEGLYRLVVMLRNDESVNVFYMNGRPCLVIRLTDGGTRARPAGGDVVEILAGIDKNLIEYVSLQKVECPECREKIRENCLRIPERREPPQARLEEAKAREQAAVERGEAESREEREAARKRRWFFWRRR